jgi:hypothetical protein
MIYRKLAGMDSKDQQAKKPSTGNTSPANRARCDKLKDAQREKASEEFLKLYYASSLLANPHSAVDSAERMDAGSKPSRPPERQSPLDY